MAEARLARSPGERVERASAMDSASDGRSTSAGDKDTYSLRQLIFLLEKKELSSGVVALYCLVSMTEY